MIKMNSKALILQEKVYSRTTLTNNNAINWYASGDNFISWNIIPIHKKDLTNDLKDLIELIGIEISNTVGFYCTSETDFYDEFIRLSFWF